MRDRKTLLLLVIVFAGQNIVTFALQVNKTLYHFKRSEDYRKTQKAESYRSFEPTNHHKKAKIKQADYDSSYDNEYGALVSNFTSSLYDDNPPLYPNPELVGRVSIQTGVASQPLTTPEVELPDDSLADADLKDHNLIDSFTYLYGFNGCHDMNFKWTILIFISSFISLVLMAASVLWLVWSNYAKEYRTHSRLYPVCLNLCCSFGVCSLIYMQAVMGVSSQSYCEKVALLLHYTYLVCSIWIILMSANITEYSHSNTVISLKYAYLIAYGTPAIYVMFNYAISLEQYEIRHYCWMSIEKGMVLGFMVPAMLFIFVNTGLIITGLKSVREKQAQQVSEKIQEIVEYQLAHMPKEVVDMIYSDTRRRTTQSTETIDGDYLTDDESPYINEPHCSYNVEFPDQSQQAFDRKLINLVMENMTWKSSWNTEGNELKTYLNLCLVLEPFLAINWVMGVVAVENADHWATPTLYLVLLVAMFGYIASTVSMTLPMLLIEEECEEVVTETTIIGTSATDDIPLLDPTVQQSSVTIPPADTISTISI